MPYQLTTATKKLLELRKRIKLVPGGTSAGKTISILQILMDEAQSDVRPTLTSVVSESFPHLRRGAMRDFLNIMQDHNYFKDERWSKTDYTYTFETGSKIEFFSADMPSKVRGPRRDRLFVNEANNINRESWEQLLLRTREEAWADWNPVTDFYMYEDYGLDDSGPAITTTDDRVDAIILTYKDNEALEPAIVEEIERRAANPAWGHVYAEGRRGEVEGLIYKNWRILDAVPHEARLEGRGLDFGFSADPAAIVALYYYNGGYILDEELYRKGMTNKPLADYLNALPQPGTIVVADSAEPKSIAELKLHGVNIVGAAKTTGQQKAVGPNESYLKASIAYVQEQRISMTKRSVNLIREYRNYMWMFDRDGRQVNKPEPGNDHALDAARYVIDTRRPRPQVEIRTPGWVQRARQRT